MTSTNRQSRTSEAYKRRVDALTRRLLIAALGWDPEPEIVRDHDSECYGASTGELLGYLRESDRALANQINTARSATLRPYYEARIDRMLGC